VEVTRRYQQVGAELYRTDMHGAILINCENNHCNLQPYRQLSRRFWY